MNNKKENNNNNSSSKSYLPIYTYFPLCGGACRVGNPPYPQLTHLTHKFDEQNKCKLNDNNCIQLGILLYTGFIELKRSN